MLSRHQGASNMVNMLQQNATLQMVLANTFLPRFNVSASAIYSASLTNATVISYNASKPTKTNPNARVKIYVVNVLLVVQVECLAVDICCLGNNKHVL